MTVGFVCFAYVSNVTYASYFMCFTHFFTHFVCLSWGPGVQVH
ncbi:hypothetical protein [Streptomyces sp. KL118A]|nr:hypothetical protein [Streptomyces sp. KL118A]